MCRSRALRERKRRKKVAREPATKNFCFNFQHVSQHKNCMLQRWENLFSFLSLMIRRIIRREFAWVFNKTKAKITIQNAWLDGSPRFYGTSLSILSFCTQTNDLTKPTNKNSFFPNTSWMVFREKGIQSRNLHSNFSRKWILNYEFIYLLTSEIIKSLHPPG
jgi:hypothetical protein